MGGLALDTSVLVELERRGARWLASLSDDEEEVHLPSMVLAELWIGVELADSVRRRGDRRRKIEALMSHVTVLPFDAEIARTYASLYAQLRTAGTPVPANDLAVAATALHHGHELLVGPRNESHFRCVPGLRVRPLPVE